MPLPLPTLDKLNYDELVSEGRASLPPLAPDWTDYNAHDPGITLLELFAWLAEADSYRLDQIPEQSVRAFLRLAGVVPRQAQAAQVPLIFNATGSSPQAVLLNKGVQVRSADGKSAFQTTQPLTVSAARLRAVLGVTATGLMDFTNLNSNKNASFAPLGAQPAVGDALYLGFDRVLAPAGTEVRLWFWTGNDAQDAETRKRLQKEYNETYAERQSLCPPKSLLDIPPWTRHYGAHTVWEYYGGNDQWLPLSEVQDYTRALTLSGGVSFKAPDQHALGFPFGGAYQQNYFIRCRLARGAYDCPPKCTLIALNAVLAIHAVDASVQKFRSTGCAAQRFELAVTPVVSASTKVTIKQTGLADEVWQELPQWDGCGAHQRAYVLVPENGSIAFGDGRVGRVPPADAQVVVEYQTGGGASGNVPANTLTLLEPAVKNVTVEQPRVALGGQDAETLNAAKARAVHELAAPTRAVTLSDYEQLALATPGVPIVRAHAIADYHPAMPCVAVSGCVTVVVIPPCPQPQPMPTDAMRRAVQRYLDRRRTLTAELHVIAPRYTSVSVSALLRARAGTDWRVLIASARTVLEEYLHPLRGGPNNTGWPMGRAVYRSELLALLNSIDGVAYVEELSWSVDGRAARRCGNISVCPHGLVSSGIHEISVNGGSACS
jgi:predicted phage baseplate assembly protein